MRLKICLAALAATVAFATPAFGQAVTTASDTAEARGLVLQRLTLTRVQDLDFGTVVASATADTVTVNPTTGGRTLGGSGGVALVATNPGSRGLFTGAGDPGVVVQISLTPPVGGVVVSGANSIPVAMVFDQGGSTSRTIGATGSFNVGVGGTFSIAANQANGLYKADFTVTAQYP
jgi:hypothetical protein